MDFLCNVIIAAVPGVLVNFITVAAIPLGKHVGKQISIQLINLAIVELIGSIMCSSDHYFAIAYSDGFEFLNESTCNFIQFLGESLIYMSDAAISLERLVVIYFPLSSLKRLRSKTIRVLV